MSFGRQTADRFEQGTSDVPGPGAYEIPSTLDERACGMDGPERWQDTSINTTSSTDSTGGKPHPTEKENRAPLARRLSTSGKKAAGPLSARRRSPTAIKVDEATAKAPHLPVTPHGTSQLLSELDEVRKERASLERENRDFRQKVGELNQKMEAASSKLDQHQELIRQLRDEIEDGDREKLQLKKEAEEVEAERLRFEEVARLAKKLRGDSHAEPAREVFNQNSTVDSSHLKEQLEVITMENERLKQQFEASERERENLQDWKEAQLLREIAAEGQRMQELKRVEEDVIRRVDEARQEVLADNESLRRKVRELEASPELESTKLDLQMARERYGELEEDCKTLQAKLKGLQSNFDATTSQLQESKRCFQSVEEQRRELDIKLRRAESQANEAEDLLQEEREKCEAKIKAIRIESEAALAARDDECRRTQAAEREAANQTELCLKERLATQHKYLQERRWEALVMSNRLEQSAACMDMRWTLVRKAATRWQIFARGHEKAEDELVRQHTELERLDHENQELHAQNQEMLTSLHQAQAELTFSLAETKRLQEREESYEQDALRMSNENAALGGHSNQKQKIKHLQSKTNEILQLREENKRLKQQIMLTNAQCRSTQFFADSYAVGSMGMASGELSTSSRPTGLSTACPGTPGNRSLSREIRTPSRTARASGRELSADDAAVEARRQQRAEELRHAKAHRRASERAVAEYQHLALLVERFLQGGALSGDATTQAVGDLEIKNVAMTPNVSEQDNLAYCSNGEAPCGIPPQTLYKRLRELSTNLSATKSVDACGNIDCSNTPSESQQFPCAPAEDVDVKVDRDAASLELEDEG